MDRSLLATLKVSALTIALPLSYVRVFAALFELLISGEGSSRFVDFEKAFMYGFRAWIAPVSLLERFTEVFCTIPSTSSGREYHAVTSARARVLRLLSMWLTMHDYDAQEKRFSALMHTFLGTVSVAGFDEDAKKLQAQLTGNFFYDDAMTTPYPAPIQPKTAPGASLQFLDIDPLELARQITLQDAALYQGMQTKELMDGQVSTECV